jgi:hypothetical protein
MAAIMDLARAFGIGRYVMNSYFDKAMSPALVGVNPQAWK